MTGVTFSGDATEKLLGGKAANSTVRTSVSEPKLKPGRTTQQEAQPVSSGGSEPRDRVSISSNKSIVTTCYGFDGSYVVKQDGRKVDSGPRNNVFGDVEERESSEAIPISSTPGQKQAQTSNVSVTSTDVQSVESVESSPDSIDVSVQV